MGFEPRDALTILAVNRFFIDQTLTPGASVELPKPVAHHAFRVLRLREGDSVALWNGDGLLYPAVITGDEKHAQAKTGQGETPDNELGKRIHIAQGLPEGDKMDWVIEKGIEAGIAGVYPIAAQRSVVKLSAERAEKRLAHWQSVAVAACSQSGRCMLPTVHAPASLAKWLGALHSPESPFAGQRVLKLWLNPIATRTLRDVDFNPVDAIIMAVGPEGGWTAEETSLAEQAGFVSVGLSPRVYRTETAALVATAQITALAGLEPHA